MFILSQKHVPTVLFTFDLTQPPIFATHLLLPRQRIVQAGTGQLMEEMKSDGVHLAGSKYKQSEAEIRPNNLKLKAGLTPELRKTIISQMTESRED